MRQLSHAIIWIDHREADVHRFDATEQSEVELLSHPPLQRLHHRKGGWESGGTPTDDTAFFRRVLGELDQSVNIFVTGPGNARSAFKAFIDNMHPGVPSHVFTTETLDHPGEQALLKQGREYFKMNASSALHAATRS